MYLPFSGHSCLGPEAGQRLCGHCAEADEILRSTRAEMFGVIFLGDCLAHLAHLYTAVAFSLVGYYLLDCLGEAATLIVLLVGSTHCTKLSCECLCALSHNI